MNGGECFGKVALFGEGEGDAGHGEDFGAEISVEGNECADCNQCGSNRADCKARHVGQRARGMCRVRQHSDYDPLDQCVDGGTGEQRDEQGKRRIAARIFGFGHGGEGGFESAVGEDQEQHGFQPLVG